MSHHGTSSPQHRSCPEQRGWDGGRWRGGGEALTSHLLIAGQTHSDNLILSKVPCYEGMCLGVEIPAVVQSPPPSGPCAGCSLQGGCAGLLLSVKVTSPYSIPSGTFIFNPSHEQFSRHILVFKGHRQGEPAPPRLAGWSCCQAARARAVRSLERPHPSSPRASLIKSSRAAGGDPSGTPLSLLRSCTWGPPGPQGEESILRGWGTARVPRVCTRRGAGVRAEPAEAGDASQQTHARVGVGCSAEAKRSVPS